MTTARIMAHFYQQVMISPINQFEVVDVAVCLSFFSNKQTENCTLGSGLQGEYKFSANLGTYDMNV